MDGAGGSRFTWDWFLNGEPLTGHSGSVSFAAMPALANNWLIARRTATTCCDFRGFMDEIRGSDVALESEDFLYFGPLSPPGGSCKPDASDLTIRDAWYRFEEGEGNDIRNAFDNAIEGTLDTSRLSGRIRVTRTIVSISSGTPPLLAPRTPTVSCRVILTPRV